MTIPDPDNNSLIAGEQWRIEGTLLDKEGNRLNLTGASIIWTLLDESGAPVTTNANVAVLDSARRGHHYYRADRSSDERTCSRSLHRGIADNDRWKNIRRPRAVDHCCG